jgi:hypothetical protein
MMVLDCVGGNSLQVSGGYRCVSKMQAWTAVYPQPQDANPTTFVVLRSLLMHRTAVKHGFPGFPRRFFQVLDF